MRRLMALIGLGIIVFAQSADAQKFVGRLSGTAVITNNANSASDNIYSISGDVAIDVGSPLVELTYSNIGFAVPDGYVSQSGYYGPQTSFTLNGALVGRAGRDPQGIPQGNPTIIEPWFSNSSGSSQSGDFGSTCNSGIPGLSISQCGVRTQDGVIIGSTIIGTMDASLNASNSNGLGIVGSIRASYIAVAFAGTPGQANCFAKSIVALGAGNLDRAAAILGYPDVSALQDVILTFCG